MTQPTWRKASFSSNSSNCVELADAGDTVLLRDSKHPEQGHVTLTLEGLAGLVGAARAGALDHLA